MTHLRADMKAVEWNEELECIDGTQALDKYDYLDREVKKLRKPMWITKSILRMIRMKKDCGEVKQQRKEQRKTMLMKSCQEYQKKCKAEKEKFFKNIVRQAKEADPGSW